VLGHVDRWQRERAVTAFPIAVWKKVGDDNGGKLAAQLTYYGFLSLFPLLLVTVTVLGYVLDGRPDLQAKILDSSVAQFPVIGDQIKQNVQSLHGSPVALIVGIAAALWGGLGVTQAAQDVMATVWQVPRRDRPSFAKRLLRGLILLVILALAVVSTAFLTGLATAVNGLGVIGRIGLTAAALVVNVGWSAIAFRALTPRALRWREVIPGAVVAAIGFQILLTVGTAVVAHQLKGATSSYGFFGIVLGLLAWIALLSTLFVYSAEVNAVAAKHLWPRSIFTPGLTDPDRAVLADAVRAEVRAPHEAVTVTYSEDNRDDDEGSERAGHSDTRSARRT